MTYSDAIQFLYGLQLFGTHFGLERARRLAEFCGNPQEKLRFIHVAGTNGKGSTCAMLESIYRAAGLRVGLFTSPHLVSFRERIQVNRQLIPESELARLVTELLVLQSSAGVSPATKRRDACPTLFEFATVMALKFFAEQKCDLVIWETGLGGRLDATNIVTPLASVITNIAFDHRQWLGDTLEKIAAEKAGIIKSGVPVITATDEPFALAVIGRIAQEKNAPLVEINSWEGRRVAVRDPSQFGPPTRQPSQIENLTLLGEHQKLNAALALATVEILQNQIPVTGEQIRAGLAGVNWPGRLQLVETTNGQKILLDGAHNVAGMEALRAALKSLLPLSGERGEGRGEGLIEKTTSSPQPCPPSGEERGKPVFIVGFLGDKDWRPMCEILAPLAVKIFAVPVASVRTADVNDLAKTFQSANPAAKVMACQNLAEALHASKDASFIVISGSLYLVGEALELLDLSPAGGDERRLNEWAGGVPPAYKLS